MARIYKFDGYVVCPNDDEVDIETLIENYTEGFPFIRANEYEEFNWDDDLEVNRTDDYKAADKLFVKLSYAKAVKDFFWR